MSQVCYFAFRIRWLWQALARQGPSFRGTIKKVTRNSETPLIAAQIAQRILFLTQKEEPVTTESSAYFRIYSKK